MKKFTIQAILLIIAIGAALIIGNPRGQDQQITLPFIPQPAKFAELQVGEVKLKVEIADTPAKRSKGLSGKSGLADDQGMLFIFPNKDKYSFWMKGLTFPLDLVWISEDKVLDITKNVPPPQVGQKDEDLPIYSPPGEIDKVLEVNAGTVDRLGIKVGDTIKLIQL